MKSLTVLVQILGDDVRFRKVPVQRLGQTLEGSGADYQVRIRKVPVQRLGEVPESSGADT